MLLSQNQRAEGHKPMPASGNQPMAVAHLRTPAATCVSHCALVLRNFMGQNALQNGRRSTIYPLHFPPPSYTE